MAYNTMIPGNTNAPWWANDGMGVPPWAVGAPTPGPKPPERLKKGGIGERHAKALQVATAGQGPVYKAPSTPLAPMVAPQPSAPPPSVTTPAAWLPPTSAGAAGGGPGFGGSTATTGGGGGTDLLGGAASMLGLGAKGLSLAKEMGLLGSSPGIDPAITKAMLDARMSTISDPAAFAAAQNVNNMIDAGANAEALSTAISDLQANFPAAANAIGLGSPGTVGQLVSTGPSMLGPWVGGPTSTWANVGGGGASSLGVAAVPGGVSNVYMSPAAANLATADAAGLLGSGAEVPFTETMFASNAPVALHAAAPATEATVGSMLEGWGGLMTGGAPFLGAWAAAPIMLGLQSAFTRGNEKHQEQAKQAEIARIESALRRVYTGETDSPSGYADVVAGATESDRQALERLMAGGPDVPDMSEAEVRASMAQRQLAGLANRDKLIEEGWLDSPEQLEVLGDWEQQAFAASGIADRDEYDRLRARSQAMFAPLGQGGIASDEARRTLGEGYLNNPEMRRIIDLFGTAEMRNSLGLERMQAASHPGSAWSMTPTAADIPITQVPGLYRDAPTQQADAGASMLNLQSFADIPGMVGRSSGDLAGINPGFVNPAAQSAYAGYIGNVPGAGRSLLDVLSADPTAYARFQAALA